MECHEPKGARCVGLGLAGLGVDDRRKSATIKRVIRKRSVIDSRVEDIAML